MDLVDVVIPVYNEEKDLPRSIETLRRFLQDNLPSAWQITIADNGSTDSTLAVARTLSQQYPGVGYTHLDLKGRGRALKKAWLESRADILSYMDVDLSTGLESFPPLVQAIREGYDIAIGSRLMAQSRIQRSFKREMTSRVYNLLIRAMFFSHFVDAQCGFKAISRRAAQALLPLVQDNAWFFDTELLLLAEMRGYRIKELPVKWLEDPDTRVKIASTAWEDIKGLLRVRFRPWL